MEQRLTIKKDIWGERILFSLGLFSTMQILSVFGITLFTYILFIAAVYFAAFTVWHVSAKNNLFVALFVSFLITVVFAYFNKILPSGFKSSMLKNFIILSSICALICLVNLRGDSRLTKSFFKGFIISCEIQLVWSILQFAFYRVFGFDANDAIFNRLLHMTSYASASKEGKLVCTGLSWHPANLVVPLVFLYLCSRYKVTKILCIFVAFASKSATGEICVFICFLFDAIRVASKFSFRKINRDNLTNALVVIASLCVLLLFFQNTVFDAIKGLVQRITDITSNKSDNSSVTHFLYYTKLPELIFSKNGFLTDLFGYGIACSGFPFSHFYGQYVGEVWVVESDYVNIFLSQGILGFAVFYFVLISIAITVCKKSKLGRVFFPVIFLAGITYNLQFNWVILVEFMIFLSAEFGVDAFSYCHDKYTIFG